MERFVCTCTVSFLTNVPLIPDTGLSQSNTFIIVMKFMMKWDEDYTDKNSSKYRNLTSEIMNQVGKNQ